MTGAGPVKWIVTQIGSRERYAVPRAFHSRAGLEQFYTDVWSAGAPSWIRCLPRGDALAHRFHAGLPANRVTAFNSLGFRQLARSLWRGRPKSFEDYCANAVWIGNQFARRVNRRLDETGVDPGTTAAFLFSTGALETGEYLRKLGVPVVVDQIDPARVDERIIREEIDRWPGWERLPGRIPEYYYSRLAEEWRLADIVLVNSNWSRSALLEQGVEEKKILVVPLCYEPSSLPAPPPRAIETGKPLTLLWLGQVVLRKGIPYLFEAAARLLKCNVRFVVAGGIGISEKGLRAAPPNVTVLGRVVYGDAVRRFSDADVFVLPTISDGFALTQLEAMSFGLPVIATPNCGDVVTHGVDGLIIPPRDGRALADAIALLEGDRQLVQEMSARAHEKVKQHRFSLDGYADAVEGALAAFCRQYRPAHSAGGGVKRFPYLRRPSFETATSQHSQMRI